MKNYKVLLFLACIVLFADCSSHNKTEKQNAQGLFLTDSLRHVVSLDTVFNKPLVDELTLNGKVDFNQEEVARVSSMFEGTVTSVRADFGDYVTKGSVLAVIRSGDVADYGKQKEEAQQQLLLARRNLNATKDMYTSGLASQKEIMSSKQDVANAVAELNRIKQIYSIYHLSSNSVYEVKAPVSGFIVQKNVNPQMQIRPDDGPIFTISGLNNVWIIANVYESDISKVHQGMSVRIVTLAYPGKEFFGKIDKVYNMLDDESKTMNVKISLNNKQFLLKPGMLANVYVETKQSAAIMPCIDSHALIFENGENFVVISNHNKLEVREVEVLQQLNGRAYISSGLKQGDAVINKNALLVYNALDVQS